MQSFDFKKFLPHLLIVVGFALFSMIYFAPSSFKGMELNSHDNVSWKAMSEEARAYYEKTGIPPYWSNSMFGGMPTYTTYLVGQKNFILPIQDGLFKVLGPSCFLFLAMLSFYVLMCTLRINRWLGLIGSLAFSLSTYNLLIIVAGHNTKMISIAYIPLVLAGLLLTYRGKYLWGGALLTFSLALLFSNTHYQIVFYTAIIILFLILGMGYKAIKEKKLKPFFIASAIAAGSAILSVGPSLVSLTTTVFELNKETMRGGKSELTINHDPQKKGGLDRKYAFRWSNGIGETFCILVPYLYGGGSVEDADKAPRTRDLVGGQVDGLPLYWGPQATVGISGPVYFGAVVCFLFVLGMITVRSSIKWWILAVCILGAMMSWGKNFPELNNLLFDHLPFYNSFRTPSMTLVIPQVLFPLLGIWGLSELLKSQAGTAEKWKQVRLAVIITAGLSLVLGIGGYMFLDFTNTEADAGYTQILKALKEDRAALALKSAFISAVFIVLAGGAIWAYIKGMIKPMVMIIIVGALLTIDLVSVDSNYFNESKFVEEDQYEHIFDPRDVDKAILKDSDPYYRVIDFTRNIYNDATQAYLHKCVGGYSPAKLEIYQDLIDVQLGGPSGQKFNREVLNMLNTKYIIFPAGKGQAAYQGNPEACGNAWFVQEVKWAKTADDEILSLNAPALGDTASVPGAFEPLKTVVIREKLKGNLDGYHFGKDSNASIKLNKYGLNELSYTSQNSRDGLAVFSDIYYPHGWEALVDGKPTPILRANYVLRAIKIPAGTHTVVFRFQPASVIKSNTVAMVSSLLVLGLCLAALVTAFRGGKEGTEEVQL